MKRIFIIGAFCLLTSCGDNDQDIAEQEKEKQELLEKWTSNQKTFEEQIAGYGWENYRMYCIDPVTGERDKVDALGRGESEAIEMGGGWFYGWFFDKDFLITYIDANYIPADAFKKQNITFDKEENAIFCDGDVSAEDKSPIPTFQIESVEGDTLKATYLFGMKNLNGKVYDQYAYGIFVRMSAEKLKSVQERCTTDLNNLK